MKIKNNTILITGGSSGIGLALATGFSELNNKVIIVGRDIKKLKAAAERNNNIDYLQCDLSNEQEFDTLVVELENQYQDINILINNAAVQHNYCFLNENVSNGRIDREIFLNFNAPVKLSNRLLPILIAKPEAAIVNVTSGLGFVPKENAPVYCATKAALHSFSVTLRYQLEKTGIKVFELIPSLVDTQMTAGRGENKISPEKLTDEFIAEFSKNIYEINIGKTGLLRTLNRFFPRIISKKLRNS